MDVIEAELLRAMEEPGCPVCRLVEKFEDEEIETILYEHPNDPAVRRAFRRSGGLCRRHAWKVLRLALSNPLLGPHGVSVIYEDVLESYLRGENETEECLLCRLTAEKERILIESLADRLPNLIEAYENSPAILCRRHYGEVLREITDESLRKRFSEVQKRKLEGLRKRLEGLIKSFDYRAGRKPTEAERKAILEAVEFLAGREVGPERGRRERREKRWPLRLK
ncbi:conserved protein of unknown function [Thermococcus nautili]|uniref:DUF6062 family protein n=1 Tax=Thermococcus nautili TaxID=195522 RepID=UPI002552F350|nr:DUF6062 family protein [Thermococcus nautili]CAI1493778.1 conserved protein of unknown function [Thermococcus nautili]